RPLDRIRSDVGELARESLRDRLVVVSLDRDGSARDVSGDDVDDRARIGAVTDEITEKGETLRTARLRVAQTRFERFDVAVNVGEKCDPHPCAMVSVGRPVAIWMSSCP